MFNFLRQVLSAGKDPAEVDRFQQMKDRNGCEDVQDHADFVRRRDVLVKVRSQAAVCDVTSGAEFLDPSRKRTESPLSPDLVRRIYGR